jgi:hypothetical protein
MLILLAVTPPFNLAWTFSIEPRLQTYTLHVLYNSKRGGVIESSQLFSRSDMITYMHMQAQHRSFPNIAVPSEHFAPGCRRQASERDCSPATI